MIQPLFMGVFHVCFRCALCPELTVSCPPLASALFLLDPRFIGVEAWLEGTSDTPRRFTMILIFRSPDSFGHMLSRKFRFRPTDELTTDQFWMVADSTGICVGASDSRVKWEMGSSNLLWEPHLAAVRLKWIKQYLKIYKLSFIHTRGCYWRREICGSPVCKCRENLQHFIITSQQCKKGSETCLKKISSCFEPLDDFYSAFLTAFSNWGC